MGKCDFSELKALSNKINKIETKRAECLKDCANELGARLLAKTIKRTPVGQYPAGSGKVGGTLRRGWTAGKAQQIGNCYRIDISNPVEYASYVEYGHRTANHMGYVEGRFMLHNSEKEIETIAPKLIKQKMDKVMEECLNDSK